MSITRKTTDIKRDAIWSVLADGQTYADWVVGAKDVRAVEDNWPQPSTRIHHTVGAGPAENKDDTVSLEVNAPEHIKMKAHFRPLGVAEITIDLIENDSGTEIVMSEELIGGIGAMIPQKLTDVALHPRNIRTLDRLTDLAAARG